MACVQMVPLNKKDGPCSSELHGSCVTPGSHFLRKQACQPLTVQVTLVQTLTRTVIPVSCGKEGLRTWLISGRRSCVTSSTKLTVGTNQVTG